MSAYPATTYVSLIPKRPDIMGDPDKVIKFYNFLDCLIGSIRRNTITAIRTINLGSLCIQYLYAPQIHDNLSSERITFTGNSSSKEGEFSLIKIDATSICLVLTSG
jgi:hypothetical protein